MKFNKSSYFPLKSINKAAPNDALFGPTTFKNERDCVYPDRVLKLNSTVIWFPNRHKTVSIGSYFDAIRNNDTAAIEILKSLDLPLDLNFGFPKDTDFSSTYVIKPLK